MNNEILPFLATPITRKPLVAAAPDMLATADRTETYSVCYGVPLLQPAGHTADWNEESLEVLFGSETCDIIRRLSSQGDFTENVRSHISEYLGREGVRAAFDRYSSLSPDSRMAWYFRIPEGERSEESPVVSMQASHDGLEYSTYENGRVRAERYRKYIDGWASHIPSYAGKVMSGNLSILVELATGAALGTYGLIDGGLRNSRLITIDIDYGAAKGVEGLLRYFNLTSKVDGIVANFWYLPFKDNSIDAICSHYGLDESRETSRVVEEISRVLVPGGRFVGVSRITPSVRLSAYFGHLGFSQQEYVELAVKADLYPGVDGLISIAEGSGLRLESIETITPASSHDRALYEFVKVPESTSGAPV